ncbi:isocitrate lyase/PEP mutase family protein [Marinibacterium profundimaris]|uniref:Carboxyvinyl-carboxyphosphonate phosphorylmutase n=1 Tax=Marinibacterium profundimaris TaxID=1679460 RepID=A0A225NF03_9RHOB|nr:isocitrate lyase/PEP mutase family protein [Marinibacterium profundimaris]OWU71480.1 carboxyvinyl-carboxyphosphonate phosphorylmutase [Marinibacterium profundimaris]
MTKPSLLQALRAGEFVVAPGVHDMIAASVFNTSKLKFAYASGYWMTASAYALPDAGIVTYTQMVDRVRTLCRHIDGSVIADADTGFGGLLNVHHTVKGYEEAGVTGIQIEDQEFPKKCGHTPFKRVVPVEDMVNKIKVACEARTNPDMAVIARTDARQSEGFEGAIKRMQAYSEAGADVLFVEALTSDDEMREACRVLDKPTMANMADGGLTPIRTASELRELGYSMAIYPSATGLAAAQAARKVYTALETNGSSASPDLDLFSFKEFNTLIGFEEVWDFERKWASAETPEGSGPAE